MLSPAKKQMPFCTNGKEGGEIINKAKKTHHYPEVGVPLLWPFALAMSMEKQVLALEQKNLKFLEEIDKIEITAFIFSLYIS